MTTKKAQVFAADLAQELALRLPALTLTESLDTDGNPLVQLGAAASASPGFLLKVMPLDWPLAKDILGLTAQIFTPHKIQVLVEANFAGTTDNVADVNTWAVLLPVLGAVILKGTRVEMYQRANGTAITSADFTSGNLKSTFDGSLVYGMLSSS